MFGLTGPAGQPRRGRQGVLVVPRGPAQPRAAALALPLSAGARSRTRSWSRRTAGGHAATPSSSCSTPGCSTTTATGSSRSPTPRRRRPRSCARSTIENHGPDEATLHVLPTLWFRNTWRWTGSDGGARAAARRRRRRRPTTRGSTGYRLEAAPGRDGAPPEALFCDNETNTARLFGSPPITPYPKDGINDHVVSGAADGQPGQDRHEGGLVVPLHGARAAAARAAAPAPPA